MRKLFFILFLLGNLALSKSQTNYKNIKFTDLFNEGTNINFTPGDLDKDTPEIKIFKKKLEAFLGKTSQEDFNINNLSYLINNETFFDLQYYTNSSWLQYFILKYKIDAKNLNDLMNLAIQQEDYNAIKILINNHYIISEKELQTSNEAKQDSEAKIQANKDDGYDSYVVSKSQIDKILLLLRAKYGTNKTSDPDGYTNLRKDKNTTSEILQKINSGEHIEVLDNSGDWYLIKTKQGKQGYVHRSRVKSN